jgi:uncharacterized membrane protein YeaQ/YmgE (transglycosylase-associated protein family)
MAMVTITIGQIIVWMLLGIFAGAVVSFMTRRRRTLVRNMILGLVGAFIGGLLFGLLGIQIAPGLFQLTIGGATVTFSDFIAAIIGALIALTILYLIRGGRFRM